MMTRGCLGAAALAFFLCLSGCSTTSQEDLNRLVKEDPAFAQMIHARDQTNAQIRLIQQDLLSKKRVLDSQVQRLRADYQAYAKVQHKRIDQYRATIGASKALMKSQTERIQSELVAKDAELNGYQKTLADIKKVLRESKGIQFSAQERQKWEERLMMLSEKIRPLLEEIQELRLRIKLKRQKINYLN